MIFFSKIEKFWKRYFITRTIAFVAGALIFLSFLSSRIPGTSHGLYYTLDGKVHTITTGMTYYIAFLSKYFSFWGVFIVMALFFIFGVTLMLYGLSGSLWIPTNKKEWKLFLKISPTLIFGFIIIALVYRFILGLEIYDLPTPNWLNSIGNFFLYTLEKIGLLVPE